VTLILVVQTIPCYSKCLLALSTRSLPYVCLVFNCPFPPTQHDEKDLTFVIQAIQHIQSKISERLGALWSCHVEFPARIPLAPSIEITFDPCASGPAVYSIRLP
jgi:hypothetical protein